MSTHPGDPHMLSRSRVARLVALLLALTLVVAACSQRDDDGDDVSTGEGTGQDGGGDGNGGQQSSIDTENCVSDPTPEIEGDTIKLVSSYPQSGLTAAFSQIANGWKAYFEYINEEE